MEHVFNEVKKQIQSSVTLRCYESQIASLQNTLERLVDDGHSGSLLILGPRGSGKSNLIRKAIEEFDDNSFVEIGLNGMFHHDEKLVMKEISRQLKVEVDVDDENFSISDSLQCLLLSASKFKGRKNKMKPVLFILEEFDRFTSSAHQNFLYNILDQTASAHDLQKFPIFVICSSCRIDVVELLEKRVRSRLSHKQLYLFNDWGFEDYTKFVQQFFEISAGDSDAPMNVVKKWNNSVRSCLKDSTVLSLLKTQYFKNKSLNALKTLLTSVIQIASYSESVLNARHFSEAVSILHIPNDYILIGLSTLEICLLLAAKHCIDKADDDEDCLNFEILFKEYQKFAQKKAKNLYFPRQVVKKAFEKLIEYALLTPSVENMRRNMCADDFKMMQLQLNQQQLVDFVKQHDFPVDVKNWAKSSVV